MPHSDESPVHFVIRSRYWGSSAARAASAPPPLRLAVRAAFSASLATLRVRLDLPEGQAARAAAAAA